MAWFEWVLTPVASGTASLRQSIIVGRFDQRLRRLLRKAGIHTGDGRIA